MYLPLHKVKVPPGNLRRALRALVIAIVSFFAFIAAKLFGALEVEYYAFHTSLVAMILFIVLAVPFITLAVSVILSPMVVYLWLDSPSPPMLRQWWFWLHVAVAVVVGICLMIVAEKKYPRRDEY
ncbi:MAG: hypothetical protein IPL39_19075 [Opitutaceae bacterium]|nr:hypothetical protein [Opitutaceae bacterium]